MPTEIFRRFSSPSASHPQTNRRLRETYQETTDIADYILTNQQHDNLSFAALVAARQNKKRWSYAVHPFNSVIFHCGRINSEIVRAILKSGIIDPIERQIMFVRRFHKLLDIDHNFFLHPKYSPGQSELSIYCSSPHTAAMSRISSTRSQSVVHSPLRDAST